MAFGQLRELTDLVTYVFRALGIPGGCDKMLMRGDKNVAHYWNFVVDGEDSTYFASIGQSSKQFAKAETYWDRKGKFTGRRQPEQGDARCLRA